MKNMQGKPAVLKQANLSLLRAVLRDKGSATRAEIVASTCISGTTVRTLLTEMQHNGEITELGLDDSIGGRKAVRYELNKNCFLGVALCLDAELIRYATVNVCGEIQKSGTLDANGDATVAICGFLDALVGTMPIRSIGIGVPGVVNGLYYEQKNADDETETDKIGEIIADRYKVPVILENDLNAIVFGFGRCYLKTFPKEMCKNVHMAYIFFNERYLSAGFLSNGRILRGWNNFVGELGMFPVTDSQTLGNLFASDLEETQYASLVAKLIAGLCCVLNPQYIALGGNAFRKNCFPLITEYFGGTLPNKMSPEILYAEDKWHDYLEGMAYLTAEHIFEDVRLVSQ